VDQPSTFFVHADSNIFDKGFLVTIGGRSVNASLVSASVIKVVTPSWNEMSEVAARNSNGETVGPCVPVVVTVGSSVLSSQCKTCPSKNCAGECGGIRFVYKSRPGPTPDKKDASPTATAKIVGKTALFSNATPADRTIQIEVTNPPRVDTIKLRIETGSTGSGAYLELSTKLLASGKVEFVLDEDKDGKGPLKDVVGRPIQSIVLLADGDIRIPVAGFLRVDLK